MTITRAYRSALDPTPLQQKQLLTITSAVRFVYNAALEQRQMLWSQWGKSISAFDQMKELTTARMTEGLEWLQEPPRNALNAAIQNLDRAFTATFRRIKAGETPGFPRFKSRSARAQGFKIFTSSRQEINAIHLPKIGRVKLHEHGYLPVGVTKIRSGAVVYDGHRWYVSLTVDEVIADPVATSTIVTVHLGLRSLAWLHIHRQIGEDTQEVYRCIENPHEFEKHLDRLRLLHRRLSRRQKGSARREDARQAVARLHEHIAAIRSNALHMLTTEIAQYRPKRIIIQDWDVIGMLAEKKYSRAIADASWGELRRQLTYKAQWKGAEIIEVPANYPASKRCSSCGAVKEDFPLGVLIYECSTCGFTIDRERNALLNLQAFTQIEERVL